MNFVSEFEWSQNMLLWKRAIFDSAKKENPSLWKIQMLQGTKYDNAQKQRVTSLHCFLYQLNFLHRNFVLLKNNILVKEFSRLLVYREKNITPDIWELRYSPHLWTWSYGYHFYLIESWGLFFAASFRFFFKLQPVY